MMLKCGERLVRCLTGQDVDRVPFGVGIGWFPWGQTQARWRGESGKADLNVWQELGYDGGFNCPPCAAGIWPAFERQVLEETANTITVRDEAGIVRRDLKSGLSMPEFLGYPVRTPDDWERIRSERLNPAAPGRLVVDWDAFRARLRQTGEAVQVGWFPYGVFGTPRELMGAEEVLVAFYEYPEMIQDMMQHMTNLWIHLWNQVAREVQIDHIHIWEDMSGRQGSLISPSMVEAFMMPCYDRIVGFAKAHGVRIVSVDTDGDCSELVPIFMRHGVNMMFPFEVQAGNDILAYRRQYPTLGIMGGLDKRALAGTRADIDREVERAARMVTLGRYVPGFDHLIPPDVGWENFRYAATRLRQVCGGVG